MTDAPYVGTWSIVACYMGDDLESGMYSLDVTAIMKYKMAEFLAWFLLGSIREFLSSDQYDEIAEAIRTGQERAGHNFGLHPLLVSTLDEKLGTAWRKH